MLRIPNPWEVGFQHASTEWVQRDRSFQSQSARSTCLLRSCLRVAFTLRRPKPSWGCAASASRIGESLNKLQLFETVPPDGFTEGVEQALLHPSEVELGETVRNIMAKSMRCGPRVSHSRASWSSPASAKSDPLPAPHPRTQALFRLVRAPPGARRYQSRPTRPVGAAATAHFARIRIYRARRRRC